MKINHTVTERFLSYVKIDTQSDPTSKSAPTTEKQKDLGRVLVKELLAMGITDAHLDDYGYVYATLPSNSSKNVPVICYCAHMDTSPDCSGNNVNPIVHKNYNGETIMLPADPNIKLVQSEHSALKDQLGNDIITADGTTLLGADNKAGVAEIMDAIHHFTTHPEVKHGTIKVLFTPDEEVGRGVDNVDLKKLGADFAYTVDGETAGHLEDETFSADGAVLTIYGISTHPGFAKNKMKSALKIASAIIDSLPKDGFTPEATEGKEGFIHPVGISGGIEKTMVQFIIRDFDTKGLTTLAEMLESQVKKVIDKYPGVNYTLEVQAQYRNMKEVLDKYPFVTKHAMEAIRRAGLTPTQSHIRGGTDGSRLSFMGLPCPNIFAGEHSFHSKLEWVSVQDMEKAVATLVHLACIWEEEA